MYCWPDDLFTIQFLIFKRLESDMHVRSVSGSSSSKGSTLTVYFPHAGPRPSLLGHNPVLGVSNNKTHTKNIYFTMHVNNNFAPGRRVTNRVLLLLALFCLDKEENTQIVYHDAIYITHANMLRRESTPRDCRRVAGWCFGALYSGRIPN